MAEFSESQIMPPEQIKDPIIAEDPEIIEQKKVQEIFDSMKSELAASASLEPGKRKKLLEHLKSLEESYAHMEKLATINQLTGLDNRRSFETKANAIINEVARAQTDPERAETRPFKNFTLLFLDIDHFKEINDTYGHDGGDEVLRQLGNFFKQRFRKTDIEGRYGGEEFVVGLNNIKSEEGAVLIAEKVRKEIADLNISYNGRVINFTVSIGLADCETCSNFQNLLLDADAALYEAKNSGRNKVVSAKELKAREAKNES